MTYMDKSIEELHEMLKSGKVTSDELVKESLEKTHEVQDKCNAFVTIIDDAKEKDKNDNVLNNIPYGIKSNYSTKGILTTGSSNTLKDYVPFFSATAVKNLESAGAVMVNKTVMDEFGMGGTGTTGFTGTTLNPWDIKRMCAGSSSGSACAVSYGVYPYALGTDTGDSIRKPAAYCGIVGYKPTYGMISRFGMYQFASSLDTVGVLTRSVEDAAIVVDGMKGKDTKDMTSWDSSNINLYKDLNDDVKGKKLFYIKEVCDINNYKNPSEELKSHLENFKETIKKCESLGIVVEEVSFDEKLLNAISAVYVVISCAEATSNMSNLTGIVFGPRGEGNSPEEMMIDHRTKGFSPLIKRRFVIGSYVLQSENQEKYFLNAKRVRRLIVDKMNELFKKYDGLLLPATGGIAPLFNSSSSDKLSNEYLLLENHMVIGNFGGYPCITIPYGKINNMPVGINLTCGVMKDALTLNIANKLEELIKYDGGEYHV